MGEKVALTLEASFGARMRPPGALAGLAADDRRGKKNARGFYRYGDGVHRGRGPRSVDPGVYRALGVDHELLL